jgi:hypothetical protein
MTSPIEEALERFEMAFRQFEAALTRARLGGGKAHSLECEAAALRDDRSRLAQELDESRARESARGAANALALERVDAAMGHLRGVLDGLDARACSSRRALRPVEAEEAMEGAAWPRSSSG